MIIGEGTNEIQRLVIARNLLKNYPSGDFLYEAGLSAFVDEVRRFAQDEWVRTLSF